MSAPDLSMARSITLGQRLTPLWQDEAELLRGLTKPNYQHHIVTKSGLAERRSIGGMRRGAPLRWQMRLAPGDGQ